MTVKDLLNTSNESGRKLIRMLLAKSKETNQNVDTANVNIRINNIFISKGTSNSLAKVFNIENLKKSNIRSIIQNISSAENFEQAFLMEEGKLPKLKYNGI